MDTNTLIVAGALQNAEMMQQRDEARAQVEQLLERVAELETATEPKGPSNPEIVGEQNACLSECGGF